MPLFRRIDPDLRALIAYIVALARDRGITLNRTKLVKLLYLIDVERVRSRRDPLTGIPWIFFHYGPWALPLSETLDAMEGSELATKPWHGSVLYWVAPDAPAADDWNAGTKLLVDRVVDRFAPLELNELLDYVYFHTGPMVDAVRGQPLDMMRARDDPRERTRAPLKPPPRPPDVEDRLARWRPRNASLKSVPMDPPGRFLSRPDDDLDGTGVRGVARISDDIDR